MTSSTSSSTASVSSSARKQKQSMLAHLATNVTCRLGCSTVHGVGVFAVVPIAPGVEPFRTRLRRRLDRVDLSPAELDAADPPVPAGVRTLVENYFFVLTSANETRSYPVSDLNSLDVSFYINHQSGDRSNVAFVDCFCKPRCPFEHIVATREIAAGDELFLDYGVSIAPDDTIHGD